MKKLLNTLYVLSPENYLSKDGENIVLREGEVEKLRLPAHNLESIVSFGHNGASPSLMAMCAEKGIGLSFLSRNGRFLARVSGRVQGNVFLRRNQYRLADDKTFTLKISRNIVAAKIANSRTLLMRVAREHPAIGGIEKLETAAKNLKRSQKQALHALDKDHLRGIEGNAANQYFYVFNELILNQKEHFHMEGRNRRPPRDPVNAMLSFMYTLLVHDVQSALEANGMDPYVGFFHTDRPGRASLALDIMEELRAYVADRMVLSLINRKQVNMNSFISQQSSGVLMTDDCRKIIISAWQKRKQECIQHPFLDEKVPIGLIPHCQALLMNRFLRGDLDDYPVFISR